MNADRHAPKKQRHKVKQLFERQHDERGFQGPDRDQGRRAGLEAVAPGCLSTIVLSMFRNIATSYHKNIKLEVQLFWKQKYKACKCIKVDNVALLLKSCLRFTNRQMQVWPSLRFILSLM